MAKKSPTRRATRPTGRELLLAGIGAVSLARKQARASLQAAALRASALRRTATAEGDRVRGLIEARAATARQALAPTIARVQKRAGELAVHAPATVRPLLARLGVAAPAKAARTPKAKRAPARAPARKAPARRRAA